MIKKALFFKTSLLCTVILLLSSCGSDSGGGDEPIKPKPETYTKLSSVNIEDGVPTTYAYKAGEVETISIKSTDGKNLPPRIYVDILHQGQSIANNYAEMSVKDKSAATNITLAKLITEKFGAGKDISNLSIKLKDGGSGSKTLSMNKVHVKKQNSKTLVWTINKK